MSGAALTVSDAEICAGSAAEDVGQHYPGLFLSFFLFVIFPQWIQG